MKHAGSMTYVRWATAFAIALSWGCDPNGAYASHPRSFALPGLPGQVTLTQVDFSPKFMRAI